MISMNPTPSHQRIELPGSACRNLDKCHPADTASLDAPDQVTVSVLLKGAARPGQEQIGLFKTLSPEQHQAFEASSGQIADLQQFARDNGLQVASADPATRTVKLQGDSAHMEEAFGVKLQQFQDDQGRVFRAHRDNVSLPKELAGQVETVLGLNNRPVAEPRLQHSPSKGLLSGYNPADVAKAYHFPAGTDGSGQTIAIIELGGGYNQSDLDAYFGKLGIETPNVSSVSVDGGQNAPENNPNGADGEVALDIDVAGAVAPKADLKVYFAPNSEQGFLDAVNQAAHDMAGKPGSISISWGAPEDGDWTDAGKQAFNQVLADAAALGVNVFSASGDNGSTDGASDKKNHADFPAASPWVVATGGTRLRMNSQAERTSEIAWGGAFLESGASGGGVSTVFPKPDYQQNAGVPASTDPQGGRGVPDVSGNASPLTGYKVLVDGQESSIGGTSAVAPLYAALSARLAQGLGAPLGFLNPHFYQHPENFLDITKGNNTGYQAGPGWDPVTGLGVPDGEKLLASLKSARSEALAG